MGHYQWGWLVACWMVLFFGRCDGKLSMTSPSELVVAEETVVYSKSMGAQSLPPSLGSGRNLTAVFLDMGLLEREMCDWSLTTDLDVLILEDQLTISLTETCTCCNDLSVWWEDDVRKWCTIAPVVVIFSDQVSGFPSNSRVESDPQNSTCLIIQATPMMNEEMKKTLSEKRGMPFQVDLEVDNSAFLKMTESTIYQFIFANLIGVMYITISLFSLLIWRRKRRLKKTHFVHGIILGTNFVQGLVLGVVSLLKCTHWLSNQCEATFQTLMWSNFFGLSLGTDILFCALMKQLIQALIEVKAVDTIPFNRRLVYAGIVTSFMDIVSVVGFVKLKSEAILIVVFVLLPILMFITQCLVVVFMVRQNRQLANLLKVSSSAIENKGAPPSPERLLAKRFYTCSWVSITSAVMACFTVSMIATQIFYASSTMFVLHITLLDMGKMLNMLVQITIVSPPTHSKGPKTTKISPTASLN